MNRMALSIGAGVIIVGLFFGWLQTERARAREEGRVEVLTEQRDSALAVLDSVRVGDSLVVDSLRREVASADSLRQVFAQARPRIDTVLSQITDTLIRERVSAQIDTLRLECDACANALSSSQAAEVVLTASLAREVREHGATRLLLSRIQEQSGESWISLGAALGVGGIYQDQQVRFGPGFTVGLTVRF